MIHSINNESNKCENKNVWLKMQQILITQQVFFLFKQTWNLKVITFGERVNPQLFSKINSKQAQN